jgi:anaerobic selenocysteine-containing dehydrogenase
LKQSPLIVAIDKQITETTAFADYILPDTTYLERWDVCVSPPSVTPRGFGVRHPMVGALDARSGTYVPILPETRVMEEILADLAFRLKLSTFETPGDNPAKPKFTASEYYRNLVGTVLDSMQKTGMPIGVSEKDVANVFDRGGFFASDAKREIKKDMKPSAKPPTIPAVASDSASAPVRESEFLLISYSQPFHRTPRSGINSWLLEVLPENRLIMNNRDANKLGIAKHDKVLVQTTDGKAQAECGVHIMPGIRPGVVAMAQGFGYRQSGAIRQIINGASRSPDKTRGAGVNVFALGGTPKVTIKKI